MPEFAKHIEITRQGRRASLRIDGEEIPWYVGETIEVRHRMGEMATVTVSFPAEHITSSDSLAAAETPAPASARTEPSTLDAAKLSLKEAERLEAEAAELEARPHYSRAALAEQVPPIREQEHRELLLANAQASIAVAEALSERPAFDAASANARTWRDGEPSSPTLGATVTDTQADIEATADEVKAALRNAFRRAFRNP